MSKWLKTCVVADIPRLGARVVRHGDEDIALFRTAQDKVFALRDKCPHKGGQLSQGIVFDEKVSCPMHGWQLYLESGEAVAPDEGCARRYPVKVEGGMVFLQVEPV
jgi:nitrite reductase (NADH) small subunit